MPPATEEVQKMSYPAVAVKLSHIKSLSDLYYLKSTCEDAERRGYPWSAIFWKEIRPQIGDNSSQSRERITER